MLDYRALEEQLRLTLGLTRRPVAITFAAGPPGEVPRFAGTQPAGCGFWRIAAEGDAFYTVPGDHFDCAIGSYTHGIALPPERGSELEATLAFMARIGYIRMEELAAISRLPASPGVIIYAPLGATPTDPDVVVFAGRPGRIMLLQEAAQRAGLPTQPALLGRPTCMALPAALSRGLVTSVACVGNRVYTGLGEDELYVMVPGKDLMALVGEAVTVAAANRRLDAYHRERQQALATTRDARAQATFDRVRAAPTTPGAGPVR
jgi:uncharacterized protein (DUF169 family)